jgi:hypothetical protein
MKIAKSNPLKTVEKWGAGRWGKESAIKGINQSR